MQAELDRLRSQNRATVHPQNDYPVSSLDRQFLGIRMAYSADIPDTFLGYRWSESLLWIPELINISTDRFKVDHDY